MTEHDDEKFASIIGALAEAFRATVTSATILAYRMALGDLPIKAIEAAALTAMRTAKYFPVASELRSLALSGGIAIEERTEVAWQLLTKTLQRHGYDRTIVFDDAALTATVRAMGGLKRLCEIPDPTWHVWSKKEFVKVYGLNVQRQLPPEACLPLVGQFDQQNRFRGYFESVQKPLLIESGLPALPNGPDVRKLIARQDLTKQLLAEARSEADEKRPA